MDKKVKIVLLDKKRIRIGLVDLSLQEKLKSNFKRIRQMRYLINIRENDK